LYSLRLIIKVYITLYGNSLTLKIMYNDITIELAAYIATCTFNEDA